MGNTFRSNSQYTIAAKDYKGEFVKEPVVEFNEDHVSTTTAFGVWKSEVYRYCMSYAYYRNMEHMYLYAGSWPKQTKLCKVSHTVDPNSKMRAIMELTLKFTDTNWLNEYIDSQETLGKNRSTFLGTQMDAKYDRQVDRENATIKYLKKHK